MSFFLRSRKSLLPIVALLLPITADAQPRGEILVMAAEAGSRLEVLFLGDAGLHKPSERAKQLIPVMLDRSIHITYTEDVERALSREILDRYDALLVYANIDAITDAQAQALLHYVADGGGFVPVHSASYCFRNQRDVVALIGAQFSRHGAGVFQTRFAEPDHPILEGLAPIESWDETYEHTLHNKENRTVLSYRQDEPYTWIRTHGEGRVFYTAWGHDERTWGHPGFHDLIERGIRWSAGREVQADLAAREIKRPFEYIDQRVAYYPPGAGRSGDGDWGQMQKPLSPNESMERILVPGGFELQLFAAEPDIRKPLTMAFDERGRLWIAETVDYPNEPQPSGEGRDRLTILEDTTGDGQADKFTVFADKLSIPTSIAFSNGGVLVFNAPDTLFLKDTTGDGKADLKQTVFTGWGTNDTHAQASNLRYGLDNWFWGAIGYAGYNGTVGGETLRFGSGYHKFRPDGSALEFQRRTSNNTWGLGFGEDGLVFGSTANNVPSVFLPFGNRYYDKVPALTSPVLPSLAKTSRFLPIREKIRQVDVHGGYTSGAGHALYTARTWPREYWNRIAFVADPTGHLVGEFVLKPDGADFEAVNPSNILVSDDEWMAPIVAEVGPDGHLWVIDWYNYIVQHNPTPAGYETGVGNAYLTDLRDKRHGRIYRVVYTGADPYEPISLEDAGPEELLLALRHDNMFWRTHAQRLLVERDRADVAPELIALVEDETVDEIGLNPGAIHALWTLHGLGALDGSNAEALAAATAALRHPSAAVRRNAALVLPPAPQTGNALLAADTLDDENPQVRLAALLALADIPSSRAAGEAIYRMHDREGNRDDAILQDAMIVAVSRHQDGFAAAAAADGKLQLQVNDQRTEGPNLLPNASFQEVSGGRPVGWQTRTFAGTADYSLSPKGRTREGQALQIRSMAGADAAFYTEVDVKPNTRYELSGWLKTENVKDAVGGLLNTDVPPPEGVTPGIQGTRDWQQVKATLSSGPRNRLVVNALFGGWGKSTGTVWYDDLAFVEIGPDRGNDVLSFVLAQLGDDLPQSAVPPGFEDAPTIPLGVTPDVMRFDQETFTVPAGRKIRILFENPDHMPHNLLILAPGSLEQVGAMADRMLSDPEARAKHYVPASPLILASTPVLNPGESHELFISVPDEPGSYPFVCTFPGHWRIMNGVMIAE